MAKKAKIEKIEKKEEVKKDSKRLLTFKQTAGLYLVCGVCWIISAILNVVANESPILDIVVGVVFITIGILYLIRDKKNK